MLTNDLFGKVNLNKNYDFPCKVLEFQPTRGGWEFKKENNPKDRNNNNHTTIIDHLLSVRHCSSMLLS